jgi:hypothetical protein
MRFTAFSGLPLAAILFVLVVISGILRAEEGGPSDDGWRRTARGWERTAIWTDPQAIANAEFFSVPQDSRPKLLRWDVHPLLLAAAQALLVAGAFCLWPGAAVRPAIVTHHKGKENALGPQIRSRQAG